MKNHMCYPINQSIIPPRGIPLVSLEDRVKGVALSKDRFQFIFKYERDLIDVLNRGLHTSNSWSIVLDRWVAKPPEDFLKYLFVWVQMRNIPVNHYTPEAIHDFGQFAGEVIEVPYDPEKAQTKDYVRVLVKFDVSKPLRRVKKITIPGGEEVNIRYDYERLQKRCYTCQRLTHEQSQGSCKLTVQLLLLTKAPTFWLPQRWRLMTHCLDLFRISFWGRIP